MGDNVFSGLFPGSSSSILLFSESEYDEKWAETELITAGIIKDIQPSWHSEKKRRAIIEHLEQLIRKYFDCQVCTFGSVPLKTYLPDGDIDIAAFSWTPYPSEAWAENIKDMLKCEELNKHAKHSVKEVHVIHAEVQIVKCLVENVIVDISFNQLGGLSTLCFLEEVDRFIGRDHLFKRSIILVKAWCYYESRVLGAHHGLISTYALETLVLYIFNIFHASIRGPFEVLYKFLQFFSHFDWDHYCLSIWGPIHISMLQNMAAEPPQRNGGELLFNRDFLLKCYQMYGTSHDYPDKVFTSKNMNVMDPLRFTNNLGRSIGKGNFFRICSAFAYGAKQIGNLLCSSEDLAEKLHAFFRNTREHCNGYGCDVISQSCINIEIQMPSATSKDSEVFVESSDMIRGNTEKVTVTEDRFDILNPKSGYNRESHGSGDKSNGYSNGSHETDSCAALARSRCYETPIDDVMNYGSNILGSDASSNRILSGDFQAYRINLDSCRKMASSHLYGSVFSFFPSGHMYGHGPDVPINGTGNVFTQCVDPQYYLNASLRGLNLQKSFQLSPNAFIVNQTRKFRHGTGTYLPNLTPGAYNHTQSVMIHKGFSHGRIRQESQNRSHGRKSDKGWNAVHQKAPSGKPTDAECKNHHLSQVFESVSVEDDGSTHIPHVSTVVDPVASNHRLLHEGAELMKVGSFGSSIKYPEHFREDQNIGNAECKDNTVGDQTIGEETQG